MILQISNLPSLPFKLPKKPSTVPSNFSNSLQIADFTNFFATRNVHITKSKSYSWMEPVLEEAVWEAKKRQNSIELEAVSETFWRLFCHWPWRNGFTEFQLEFGGRFRGFFLATKKFRIPMDLELIQGYFGHEKTSNFREFGGHSDVVRPSL